MPNTRVAGHTLRLEGKPHSLVTRQRLRNYDKEGVALCSCGWVSSVLFTDNRRKQAHAEHKRQVASSVKADATSDGGA